MRFKCAGVDQDEVNRDLRARFGDTCTRTQILAYRTETGIDPRWVRKNSECNIGRGLYRIPGGDGATIPAPVSAPKYARKQRDPEIAETRSVIPTPFDDGAYDEPEPATDTPEPVKTKRGRKSKVESADDPQALVNQSDYDPTIGERAAPVFIHAWVCPAENCPGRKPGSYYPEDNSLPKCECGTEMVRHSWAKKTRSW